MYYIFFLLQKSIDSYNSIMVSDYFSFIYLYIYTVSYVIRQDLNTYLCIVG